MNNIDYKKLHNAFSHIVAILICMFTAPVTSAHETNCNLIDTAGIESIRIVYDSPGNEYVCAIEWYNFNAQIKGTRNETIDVVTRPKVDLIMCATNSPIRVDNRWGIHTRARIDIWFRNTNMPISVYVGSSAYIIVYHVLPDSPRRFAYVSPYYKPNPALLDLLEQLYNNKTGKSVQIFAR